MRIGKATVKAIIECIEAINDLSADSMVKVSSENVHEYLRMSFEYVNDAIELAILLHLITNGENLQLTPNGKKLVKSSTKQSQQFFNELLQKIPFTNQLIELIRNGKNTAAAVIDVVNQYKIQGNQIEILYSLRNLLKFANIECD